MPLYTFYNTNTGDYFDEIMSFDVRQKFLENNKHIESCLAAPSIVSGVSLTDKVPSGFKEVLSKISEQNPNTALSNKIGGKGIKEAKVQSVLDKHVEKITKRLDK